MGDSIRSTLCRRHVWVFDLYMEDLFTYVVETEAPLTDQVFSELRAVLPLKLNLENRVVSFQLPLPGIA